MRLKSWDAISRLPAAAVVSMAVLRTTCQVVGFAWLYEHFYHQKLEAPQIISLWEQGDAQAREHVERYLDLLAVCLGNILTIVDRICW